MTDKLSPAAALLLIPASLAIGIPLALYKAWVISPLWGWFVTPLTGIATPSISLFAGLIYLIHVVRFDASATRRNEDDPVLQFATGIFHGLFLPWVALLCGWLIMLAGKVL